MGRLEAQGGCSLRCGGQRRPHREGDSWTKTWRWTREETTWLHVCVKVPQSCPTLCNPMDYTVHGILQNTGVGGFSLLQGIFPTQGSNPGLPTLQLNSSAEPQGKPDTLVEGGRNGVSSPQRAMLIHSLCLTVLKMSVSPFLYYIAALILSWSHLELWS